MATDDRSIPACILVLEDSKIARFQAWLTTYCVRVGSGATEAFRQRLAGGDMHPSWVAGSQA